MKLLSGLALVLHIGATIPLAGAVQAESPTSTPGQDDVKSKPPNFLFIMADDQDLLLDSTSYTPLTLKHIAEKGATFHNHFVTTVIYVYPPWGGSPKFIEQGFNDNYLPVWLQNAGYNTYYTGKLMNAHSVENYDNPYTYDYMNATYQQNKEAPKSYLGQHTTEIIREKALGFLDDAIAGERPFFVAVSPIAPHSNFNGTYGAGSGPLWMDEPIPEKQSRSSVPKCKDSPNGQLQPSPRRLILTFHEKLPYRNQSVIDCNDHYYRQRLRALQGVDELVDSLVTRLKNSGKMDNTYIIFTSDNGFHISQHRLPPGKTCGFEEDVRVPFFVRGPGIPEGHQEYAVTTHIDLAPTVFDLAGISLRSDFDGTPLPLLRNAGTVHEHVAVEYWGQAMFEGGLSNLGTPTVPNNTYKAIRILADEYNLFYSVWCNNEHELYDLSNDPHHVNNLWTNSSAGSVEILGRKLNQVIPRLDAPLMVLKSCKGFGCIKPWTTLHPEHSVDNLKEALDEKYDVFYQKQPKVSYDRCEYGYTIDAEGPQHPFSLRMGYSLDQWI
ncbi:Arylsulfatase, plant [Penicillium camemberti]|uniref:Arylsulfatase, plant n=1 Tax=Penicillium camemberti (strain FM 013) TaxID=1429867 RepID=A0A0G4PHK7_PENC3|nr:Arylsulfatase, plant [Penicillium camemberti]